MQPKLLSISNCVLVQLFGWDLKSLWQTASKHWCHVLLRAGRLAEAHESYRYMMDISDDAMKASCLDWSIGKYSVASPCYNSHPHLTQLSSKIALKAEMLPSPRTNTTGLSSYTRQRSTWILQPTPSLPNVVWQTRETCYGRMRFLMRKRCNTIYCFLLTAHFRD